MASPDRAGRRQLRLGRRAAEVDDEQEPRPLAGLRARGPSPRRCGRSTASARGGSGRRRHTSRTPRVVSCPRAPVCGSERTTGWAPLGGTYRVTIGSGATSIGASSATRSRLRQPTSPSGPALWISTSTSRTTPRCAGTTVTSPRQGASACVQPLPPSRSRRDAHPQAAVDRPRSSTLTGSGRPTIASVGAVARARTIGSVTPGQTAPSRNTPTSAAEDDDVPARAGRACDQVERDGDEREDEAWQAEARRSRPPWLHGWGTGTPSTSAWRNACVSRSVAGSRSTSRCASTGTASRFTSSGTT